MKHSKIFRYGLLCVLQTAVFFFSANSRVWSQNIKPGETFVGKIEKEDMLIKGPKADGKKGDYKLSNSRVSFIVESLRMSSGYGLFGGTVIDAVYRDSGGKETMDYLGEVFPGYITGGNLFGVRTFEPEDIQIVSPGGKNKMAILRVKGKDGPVLIVEEVTKRKGIPLGIEVTIDYILKPDVNYLMIKTTMRNLEEKDKIIQSGNAYLLGDGVRVFGSRAGFDEKKMSKLKNIEMVGAAGREISYGWFSKDATFGQAMQYESIFIGFYNLKLTVKQFQDASFEQNLVVGKGDTAELVETMDAGKGTDVKNFGKISGEVLDGKTKKPVLDARIHFLKVLPEKGNIEEHALLVKPDKKGKFSVNLPPGAYKMWVFADGRTPLSDKTVVVEEKKTLKEQILLPAEGRLKFMVQDQAGNLLPCTLHIVDKSGKKEPDPVFGEDKDSSRFYKVYFSKTGDEEIPLDPGQYQVYFSRGMEYEISGEEVKVEGGLVTNVLVSLARSVDTKGYLSGDFHIHSLPSPDSDDSIEDKVISFAGVGLEIPVATDHNWNTDYTPYIEKLGLTKYMKSVIGNELTTIVWGHFNSFPLTHKPDEPNWGAVYWYGKKPNELFEALRAEPGDPIIQINHPRSGGGSGYFSTVGYDPLSGKATAIPDEFDDTFDAIEIFNGKRAEQLFGKEGTAIDWYSFLLQGRKKTAVGNSDSHHAFNLEVGYPRNMVLLDVDDPTKMENEAFVKAVREGRVVVCGGPFIELEVNGMRIGDLVRAKGGKVNVHIKVQSPLWMPLTKVTLIGNAGVVESFPIDKNDKVVKFDETIAQQSKKDMWYIVIAEGEKDLYPVYPGAKPYSFTNAIWVDFNGNGQFDPPGVEVLKQFLQIKPETDKEKKGK